MAGTPISVSVSAKDPYGNIAVGYLGTVHFTSTDSQAVLPADYAFQSTDAGIHTFSVTLATSGAKTITATDTAEQMRTVQGENRLCGVLGTCSPEIYRCSET